MDDRERTYLSRDERRAQLLAVGLQLFSSLPYDDVSIDAIASGAGVSKGLLYHYFGSKRGLYVTVVRHAAGELLATLAPDRERTGVDNARAGLVAYLRFVDDRADAYLALMSGGLGADPEVQATLEATREVIAAQLLVGAGLESAGPAARLAVRAWLGGVEAASLDWLRRRDVGMDVLVDLFSASLFVHLVAAARLTGDAARVLDALPLLGGLMVPVRGPPVGGTES